MFLLVEAMWAGFQIGTFLFFVFLKGEIQYLPEHGQFYSKPAVKLEKEELFVVYGTKLKS